MGFLPAYPQLFCPLYAQTNNYDPTLCPICHRAYSDNWLALVQMGIFLGFIAFECIRMEWRNVKLSLTIGGIAGIFWVIFRFYNLIPNAPWRGWETLSGLGIGIALGVGFYVYNKPIRQNLSADSEVPVIKPPSWQLLLGIYMGLVIGLGWSVEGAIWGFADTYYHIGNNFQWQPGVIAGVPAVIIFLYLCIQKRWLPKTKLSLSEYWKIFWLVFVIQLACGLIATGPISDPFQVDSIIYYIILAILDGIILYRWKSKHNLE